MLRLAFVALFVACATPGPVPPPVPTPTDPFANAIIDCGSPEVPEQSVAADPLVLDCLAGDKSITPGTAACLAGLYPASTLNTIACIVRDYGIVANRRVLAGETATQTTTIDNAARAWITQERLGYRSVIR